MGHTRFKRGVIHLYNMVVCATGCNPLAYKGYGCYCGFLGSGYVIDGIDQYVIYIYRKTNHIIYNHEFLFTRNKLNVPDAARCMTGVTTLRNVPCSRNTLYHITGDVIMVINLFVVCLLIIIHLIFSL